MNVPMSWLKEAANINENTQEILNKLTEAGIEVEGVKEVGKEITKVVVGKIVSLERYPNADRLWVTQTDIGTETLQIVTGADNLKEGDYIPVAVDGSTLVNGLKIKKSKMRGMESNGMLCSLDELGCTLAEFPEAVEDGIYVFPENELYSLGVDAKPMMGLNEEVADINILANRPDTNSIIGLAREVAAVYGNTLTLPNIAIKSSENGNTSDYVSVEILDSMRCNRFVARVVKNVKIEPSPKWMRQRLTAAGLRPINNIVDITNYVMLEYGQPLHAFDIRGVAVNDKNGKHNIIIRTAKQGEKFTTLDGVERELSDTMLLVADHEKAIGIAGVMGGENSKISENTTTILFESANFDSANIRQTTRSLGMRTDASARFEKGQDPNQSIISINRAMELVELLGCGEVVPDVVDSYPVPRAEKTITFKTSEIHKILGVDEELLPLEAIKKYLLCVGINVSPISIEENFEATIPTFRADMTGVADLAEEVARLYGLNKIKSLYTQELCGLSATFGAGKHPHRHRKDAMKLTLAALGYSEALTYPFDNPKTFDKLLLPEDSYFRKSVAIKNPLNEDFSILRTITLGGILESLSRNYNKGNDFVALFEFTEGYISLENPETFPFVTLATYGEGMDYLSFKGDIEEFMLSLTNRPPVFKVIDTPPYMHPGRFANIAVQVSKNPREPLAVVGYIGELHPTVASNYDIKARVCVAELDLEALLFVADSYKFKYTAPFMFPSLNRDLAFKVKTEVSAANIEATIREKGGSLLSEVKLFDVYQGEQVGEGYKSMAYSLRFRAPDRSLTDDEVPIKAIISNLEKKLDAQMRG